MKAVILTAYGTTDKLELKDLPEPQIGPNDIKVKMAGAGINPIDWKLRSGAMKAMMPLAFPAVLGRDVSGVVVEVGASVSRFSVGSRVMGLVNNAYAEVVVAPADAFAQVPAQMDLVDAAALPLVLVTGAQLIEEFVRPNKGDVVLVTGAVGGVGRTAIFVAKSMGAKVWAGVREAQRTEAEKLGANGVVALDRDADIAKLPQLDAIADAIGGPTIAKLFGKLKPGGTIGTVVGEPLGAKEQGFMVRGGMAHADPARLSALAVAVVDGRLVIPIAKKFPLAEARQAQQLAEHHPGGKVILTGHIQTRAAGGATDHKTNDAHRS